MPKRKHYTLTALAEADLRAAKKWSLSRWGKNLTQHYFSDLHDTAEHIGQHHTSFFIQPSLNTCLKQFFDDLHISIPSSFKLG